MHKITKEQLEKKYIIGKIRRFDNKFTVPGRMQWDLELNARVKDWGIDGGVKPKSGFTLQDRALKSSARLTLNTGRPVGYNPNLPAKPNDQSLEISVGDINDSKKNTQIIKKVAHYFGADLVGICQLDRRWVYFNEEIPESFRFVIMLAFEKDYDLLRYSPSYIYEVPGNRAYTQMAVTNAHLASFIENLGFKAIDCQNDTALSIPLAMQAGLGELGRLGLLITPQFGPRVRLSKVITDLPLIADSPIEFGVTQFCDKCMKCARLCPSQSISYGERTVEPNNVSNNSGILRWPVNLETCRIYWARAKRYCSSCVACCPYNKPHTWPHRTALWLTDHFSLADPLYIKMDDLLGYGKPRKTDKFWEEWNPH
jgi:reductive dehalogenase